MLRSLIPYAAYSFLSLVGWTTRVRVRDQKYRDRLRADGKKFIYAVWHNRQAFVTYTHRHDKTSIIVSRSRDGQIIAKVMELSGLHASRGSSSRGAGAAVRQMIKLVAEGWDIGFTPDGPKGPVYEVKTGVLFLARKLGIPILPMTISLSNRLVLNSWDSFNIPMPFSRAVIRYGAPISVGDDADLKAKAAELKDSLDEITAAADHEVTRAGWRGSKA